PRLERDDRLAVMTVQMPAFAIVVQEPVAIAKRDLSSDSVHACNPTADDDGRPYCRRRTARETIGWRRLTCGRSRDVYDGMLRRARRAGAAAPLAGGSPARIRS